MAGKWKTETEDTYFRCDCSSRSHTIATSDWGWGDGTDSFTISMVLESDYRIWHRVWEAIKYVFQGENICFTECMLNRKDIDRLIETLQTYQRRMNALPPTPEKTSSIPKGESSS